MLRFRLSLSLAALCLCAVAAPGSLSAHPTASSATITVTAGKPRELSFTVTPKSAPAGIVVFKVTNKGKVGHSFKICTKPSGSDAANSCTGPATGTVKPGKAATLTAHLTTKGSYEFLSTVAGQAASGMKGVLGVTAKSTSTPAGPSPTPTPAPTTSTPATTGATCVNPQNATVSVQEGDSAFTISQNPVHCGTITFDMSNTGSVQHNFDILGVVNGAGDGAVLSPGQSASIAVTLAPKQYTVQSDVGDQAAAGLQSSLTVTSG